MQKLESLVELRELNLANNCLKVIECLDNLVKLQVLNLGGNQITSIPGPAMKKLRCLKVLKLSHNKLETVSTSFVVYFLLFLPASFFPFFHLLFPHIPLCWTHLPCTVLYCTVLYCTVLYCTVLCYAVLCCTVLCCTVLTCTVLTKLQISVTRYY